MFRRREETRDMQLCEVCLEDMRRIWRLFEIEQVLGMVLGTYNVWGRISSTPCHTGQCLCVFDEEKKSRSLSVMLIYIIVKGWSRKQRTWRVLPSVFRLSYFQDCAEGR
jgi:hypothetical protein